MRGLRRILGIIITLIVINTGLYRVDAFDNINFKNITIEQGLS